MSMSQEEIESLMNGLDFEDEESTEPASEEDITESNVSEDDMNELISQTEDINPVSNDGITSEESVDDLLSSIEKVEESSNVEEETNIDDIFKELDSSEVSKEAVDDVVDPVLENTNQTSAVDESDVNELINETVSSEDNSTSNNQNEVDPEKWADGKIQKGIFPLPAENDTKVVNQLSEVANDSEEKVSKIFDVLSNILDYNNDVQTDVNSLSGFNDKQIQMLTSLNQKFPNIEVFDSNLTQAQEMGNYINNISNKLNESNNEIFQAMELMQFNDINRQKIERVMSVIRKLSIYLNNLFEDDGSTQEIAVAKHIHGDGTEDLLGDQDLESLIDEFNK